MKVLIIGFPDAIEPSKDYDGIIGEKVEFISTKNVREAEEIIPDESFSLIYIYGDKLLKEWIKRPRDKRTDEIITYGSSFQKALISQEIRNILTLYKLKTNEEEEELQRWFGDKESRHRKEKRYFNRLIKNHSEKLIRDILKALVQNGDRFNLKGFDLGTEPLENIIVKFAADRFYFEKIQEKEDGTVTVAVSRGLHDEGYGATFVFRYENDVLVILDEPTTWNS